MSNQHRFSRRMALRIGTASVAGTAWAERIFAQPEKENTGPPKSLNRFPRMMQEYFEAKLAQSHELGQLRRAAISSRADAESYVKTVRNLIRQCFGAFPERTPLNPRITGIVERDVYRIEKIIFESRPEFFVTANLYVPQGRPLPLPAVVGLCGHSINGKAAEAYQSFAQGLARHGYIVLIIDPIGQGERLQYPDVKLKSKVGAGVHEHLLLGNQQFLVGEFLGSWIAWDGIRALDYLLTRDEVDPNNVGITGNSGGRTMTMWLCGLESRWTMAAPSCAVTTFRHNFQNELPTDTEQCPPLVLKHGLDHGDFLAAMAPKPVIILASEKDYFDVRGSIETYERLKPLYKWLGAEQNIRLFIGPHEHGYSQPNREAMYGFFNEQTGKNVKPAETQHSIETDETLKCSPTGQVINLGSKTVFSFTARASKDLTATRREMTENAIRQRVAELIPSRPESPPHFNILRPIHRRGDPKAHLTTYAIETEPHVQAIVSRLDDRPLYSRPPIRAGRVVLFVAHHSSDLELREEPLIGQLINDEPASEFYCVDVRGIGDSRPDTCGGNQFLEPYGSDYFYAAHLIMIGQSYPVQRAFDILRVIDWLKSHGRTEIHLAAVGWGTIPATLAAVVSDDIKQVTLKNAPTSYSQIAETEYYDWPLSALIPHVLKSFDLPDGYRLLDSKLQRVAS